jgi:hypothetical protein
MLKATLEIGPARPSQDANHESRPRRPRRELLGDDDLNTFLLQDTSKGLEIYVGGVPPTLRVTSLKESAKQCPLRAYRQS